MQERLEYCIRNGRNGKGNIFMWAGGNGGMNGDNANYDGYANSRFTVPIAAIDELGLPAFYRFASPVYFRFCTLLLMSFTLGTTQ